jgi:Rrf2 family protein
MELNRQTDYALRAVLYLASHPLASISEVAEAQFVPHDFLAKIMQKLSHAGIVKTARGVGGGISLARTPGEISMLDVIEALEGPLAVNRCFARPGECRREEYCAVHEELAAVQSELARMLDGIDFGHMARRERKRAATAACESD